MPAIEVKPQDPTGATFARVVQECNAKMNPDNDKIRPKTLDDILEGLLIFRSTIIERYNEDLDQARTDIRAEEKEKAEAAMITRSERQQRREADLKIKTSDELKDVIRSLKAFDELQKRAMSYDAFIEYCEKIGVPEALAEVIYASSCFSVEKRRKIVSENVNMLA